MSAPLAPRAQLEEPGPWTHRHVSAGGASFHVAEAGPANPDYAIVLLHDFPFSWRSWRAVMPVLAEAGYRVIAMDLRGFGTSDMQRDEPDLAQLARDVSSLVATMGIASFSVVGAGLGGAVAWMLGAQAPVSLRSLIVIAAPHPLERPGVRPPTPLSRGRILEVRLDVPLRRVRLLENGKLVDALIKEWAAPSNRQRLLDDADPYRAAMKRRFAAVGATNAFSASRHLNLASRRALDTDITVPVLSLRCAKDASLSARDYAGDSARVDGLYTQAVLRDCGHFAPEESPEAVAALVLRHVAAAGAFSGVEDMRPVGDIEERGDS